MSEFMEDTLKFITSVPKKMDRGVKYEWKCPLCSGTVKGARAASNGHLHAGCDGCGMRIME